ncbi:MAG: hypothetical protein LBD12_02320 [Clostridiales Family XIII bacterium]|jgi:trk system potassium uptake protein TrkH|nr:hypothetical protein [Clostridiales Family XIII bacterium]
MNLNAKLIRKLTGLMLLIMAAFMIPTLLIAVLYREYSELRVFASIFAAVAFCGSVLFWPLRRETHQIKAREGFFVVTFCWVLTALLCALPYFFTGVLPNFVDAFFEATSDVTTTGINLISHPERLPHTILFWRSLINWVGGLGILLLVITILPALGIGTSNLANAETMGSGIDKYRMRISENAKYVYRTYIGLTLLEFLCLLLAGMDPFHAMSNAFSSISNCGVVDHSIGIRLYDNFFVELIITVFCIFGSLNFSTLQLPLRRRFKEFFGDPEIRIYSTVLVTVYVLVILTLWQSGTYDGLGGTLKNSTLQIFSFTTTAGYSVTDYGSWPTFCRMILFFVVFIGGCSASTAGGLKVSRFAILLMLIRRNFYKRLHPNAVFAVKIGNRAIPADKVSNITVTAILYSMIFAGSCILLSLDGLDLETTIGSVLAALSNTGLGWGATGYGNTFAVFSEGGRLLLTLLMFIGRLEIFAVFLLFTPSFWKRNN